MPLGQAILVSRFVSSNAVICRRGTRTCPDVVRHTSQGTVLETNVASARALQKCGYRHEGLLRSFRMVRGIPGNFQIFARLNDD